MVKVVSFFGMSLGAFLLFKSVDNLRVSYARHQDEMNKRLEREAESKRVREEDFWSDGFGEEDLASEERMWDLYEKWRSHHKVYRDLEERRRRFNLFKESAKYVHEVNHMDKSYKLGLNIFSDMTKDEFMKCASGCVVTGVKDQGQCERETGEGS